MSLYAHSSSRWTLSGRHAFSIPYGLRPMPSQEVSRPKGRSRRADPLGVPRMSGCITYSNRLRPAVRVVSGGKATSISAYHKLRNALNEIRSMENCFGYVVRLTDTTLTSGLTERNPEPMELSAFAKKIFDKDIRVLVKAGLMHPNLDLTVDGKMEIWALLYEQYKEQLVKVAKERLSEQA